MKIFLNDRFISFSQDMPEVVSPLDMVIAYESPGLLLKSYQEFERAGEQNSLIIVGPSIDKAHDPALSAFFSFFKQVDAAGGLVKNEKGEYLFIHRLGYWDLPKGKIDGKDKKASPVTLSPAGKITSHSNTAPSDEGRSYPSSAYHAAVREVKEETGLKSVTVTGELPCTWHIYTRKEKRMLKKTYWFTMEADSHQSLRPQSGEGIFLAKWIGPEGINQILGHTYASIRELMLKVV
jgi:8-oxo-dGTP pyrophosphatase MutT (NUDIX family)